MTTIFDQRTWGLDTPTDTRDWLRHANCTPTVAEWFWFPANGTSRGRGKRRVKLSRDNQAAIALCRRCPVKADCLEYELAHPTSWGYIAAGRIWPEGVEP